MGVRTDGRTICVKTIITTFRDCGLASWINFLLSSALYGTEHATKQCYEEKYLSIIQQQTIWQSRYNKT